VKLVLTFADRGCHVVGVTDPYGRILAFLDRHENKSFLKYKILFFSFLFFFYFFLQLSVVSCQLFICSQFVDDKAMKEMLSKAMETTPKASHILATVSCFL
jgi:hypothetical protein